MRPLRVMTFEEVVRSGKEKYEANLKFFNEAGKCVACKVEDATLPSMRCSQCNGKIGNLLNQLKGPGFKAFMMGGEE